jgi:hypothetical protein
VSDPRRPLQVLLLCDRPDRIAATLKDHLDALVGHSRHVVRPISVLGDLPEALDLAAFDAVVVHYGLVLAHDSYVSPATRARLAAFRGLKAQFIQDEYRFIDRTIAAMREIGLDLLFTCVPEPEIGKVYSEVALPGVRKVNVLTGYVPPALADRAVPAFHDRAIDVGYRARKVPAWLGALGQEKYTIGIRFQQETRDAGLRLDFSFREEDRLYGQAWIDFVARCRAMLGVESGASVFDFTGDIQQAVDAHLLRDPDASFEELQRLYFADAEGRIRLNQISPRCFEMAALRTLMILYEGEYSGILQPWRHYVPLRKDHSNLADVLAVLRDPARAEAIIACAHAEIACNPVYGFPAHVAHVDAMLAECFKPAMAAAHPPLSDAAFAAAARPGFTTRRRLVQRRVIDAAYRAVFRGLLGGVAPETRERIHGRLRPALEAGRRGARRLAGS